MAKRARNPRSGSVSSALCAKSREAPYFSIERSLARTFLHGAAVPARAVLSAVEEALEDGRQLLLDVADVLERLVEEVIASFAVPLKSVLLAGPALTLDDETDRVGKTPRRMRHVRRQQQDVAFADGDVDHFSVPHRF